MPVYPGASQVQRPQRHTGITSDQRSPLVSDPARLLAPQSSIEYTSTCRSLEVTRFSAPTDLAASARPLKERRVVGSGMTHPWGHIRSMTPLAPRQARGQVRMWWGKDRG